MPNPELLKCEKKNNFNQPQNYWAINKNFSNLQKDKYLYKLNITLVFVIIILKT